MAINISAWSIRHPLPPLVMAAAIVALGYISFNKLPVTRMPNVDVPVVSVTVTQFGAAPAELESQVTKTVEDAVSGVAGAHHINSVDHRWDFEHDDHVPLGDRHRSRAQ